MIDTFLSESCIPCVLALGALLALIKDAGLYGLRSQQDFQFYNQIQDLVWFQPNLSHLSGFPFPFGLPLISSEDLVKCYENIEVYD